MSTPLTILLSNSDGSLGLLVSSLKVESGISQDFRIKVKSLLSNSIDIQEQLSQTEEVKLEILGDYGNPNFELYLANYEIGYKPGSDILEVTLELTDRWQRFRELKQTGVYYYSNIYDIWGQLYGYGFSRQLNSKIEPQLYFDKSNTNKYPTHPIYTHYQETHWEFLQRAFAEHGLNYTWIAKDKGFDYVISNSGASLDKYFEDRESYNKSLYTYNLDLSRKFMGKDDIVIDYVTIKANSGYVTHESLADWHKALTEQTTKPKLHSKEFVKRVRYIHHPAYEPETYLESSFTFPDEKFKFNRDLKTKFNEVNQALS